MRVLFVLTEIGSRVPSHHAIGVLSAVLKQAGHETFLYEADRLSLQEFDTALLRFKPDVAAFTSVSQQLPYIKQLIARCRKEFPRVATILGGTHAILRPNVIGEIPGLDALCVNEGEEPFLGYLKLLEGAHGPAVIPNLRVRAGRSVILDCLEQFSMTEQMMTALPFEDRGVFPKWRNTPKGVPLESLGIRPRFWFSRGCPYQCTYCSVPTLRKSFPRKKFVRCPSPDRVIAEVEAVADRWTFSTWIVDDDVWAIRKSWILELAKKFPSRLKHLGHEVCMRIECADEDVLRAMKDMNCTLIKFGLESGDEALRRSVLNRRITDERIIEVFDRCRRLGLKAHAFCIIGFPEETRQQIWRTVRLNQTLRPDRVQISIFFPYPGTPLGDRMEREGRIIKRVDNYFEESPLDLRTMRPWEVKLYFRLFRLAVYVAYSPRLAWSEVVGLAKWLRDKFLRRRKAKYDLEI